MTELPSLKNATLENKVVLVRVDFNVPLNDLGQVQDDTRIDESLPTIQYLLSHGAKVVLMTHLGRPDGKIVESLRLDLLVPPLEEKLKTKILKINSVIGDEVKAAIQSLNPAELLLLENLRFEPGEEKNEPEFCKSLASLGDLYVNDAFGTAHRAHASTEGLAHLIPSYAGFLLEKEVSHLSKVLESPEAPLVLIVGGAKIDTKIGILEKFIDKADSFLIGGGLANTFLAAQTHSVGNSLYELKKVSVAQDFLNQAIKRNKKCILPIDLVLAKEISEDAPTFLRSLDEVDSEMKILDLGPKSIQAFIDQIQTAKTIIWNGPLGLFEFTPFSKGTQAIAMALASHPGTTILGGGDTLDALKRFKIPFDAFTHVSTGGGAMLEFLEGKELPGIAALKRAEGCSRCL